MGIGTITVVIAAVTVAGIIWYDKGYRDSKSRMDSRTREIHGKFFKEDK
jgi:hypothetical protein